AWFVLGMARPEWFQAGKLTTILLWGLVVAIFLTARVPARPYAALILPPLLSVCWAGLRRNARTERRPDALDGILGRIRPGNVVTLALIPAAAIAVYAGFRGLNVVPPTNVVLYVLTMPLGFWYFFRSLWVIYRKQIA